MSIRLMVPSFNPQPKGQSRLEAAKATDARTVITEKDFLRTVRERDRMRCRCCDRKTRITLEHVKDRCEVHHLHGRRGPLRFEDRAALVLCLDCHQPVTGKVARKVVIIGTQFFELQAKGEVLTCIDARYPVKFERIV